MKQKVLKISKKHNDQPNRLALARREGKSPLLGIVVPHLEGRAFPSVMHGIETAARKAGYNMTPHRAAS